MSEEEHHRPERREQAKLSATLYAELRGIAARQFRRERAGHTLQPTALVHEAFLKLAQSPPTEWGSRAEVLACAAQAMRQVLVDHARARNALKRGGRWKPITLQDALAEDRAAVDDLLMLDRALRSLEECDPRAARVAEMRIFGGLGPSESAEALAVSVRTVESDWATAKLWLRRAIARTS
ncbi:MAG: RNA polymerase subunit sigma-70 [Candidatus Eisenbacteria bacterium]|nr:RNA polymerase subunit sigma-70 [Candidatus Eisenbacteria bacterium]